MTGIVISVEPAMMALQSCHGDLLERAQPHRLGGTSMKPRAEPWLVAPDRG